MKPSRRAQTAPRGSTSRRPARRRRPPRARDAAAAPAAPFRISLNAFRVGLVAVLGAGLGAVLVDTWAPLATVLTYVGLALFLSLAAEPAIEHLRRVGVRRPLAVLVIVSALVAALAAALLLVTPLVISRAHAFATELPALASAVLAQPWAVWLQTQLGSTLDLSSLVQSTVVLYSDPQQLALLWGGLFTVGTDVAGVLFGLVVVSILAVYFSATLPAVKTAAYQLVPLSRRAAFESLAEDMVSGVGRYIVGQLVLALANGLFTLLVTMLVGGPTPVLMALVAFVGALIPLVGSIVGSSLVTLACLAVSPLAAVIAGVAFLIYLQVEAYVLAPRVMARAVAVPGSLVIIGALGGAALGGILGAFVAVPVLAAGVTFYHRFVVPRQAQR